MMPSLPPARTASLIEIKFAMPFQSARRQRDDKVDTVDTESAYLNRPNPQKAAAFRPKLARRIEDKKAAG